MENAFVKLKNHTKIFRWLGA